jgi:hypothetical protein
MVLYRDRQNKRSETHTGDNHWITGYFIPGDLNKVRANPANRQEAQRVKEINYGAKPTRIVPPDERRA